MMRLKSIGRIGAVAAMGVGASSSANFHDNALEDLDSTVSFRELCSPPAKEDLRAAEIPREHGCQADRSLAPFVKSAQLPTEALRGVLVEPGDAEGLRELIESISERVGNEQCAEPGMSTQELLTLSRASLVVALKELNSDRIHYLVYGGMMNGGHSAFEQSPEGGEWREMKPPSVIPADALQNIEKWLVYKGMSAEDKVFDLHNVFTDGLARCFMAGEAPEELELGRELRLRIRVITGSRGEHVETRLVGDCVIKEVAASGDSLFDRAQAACRLFTQAWKESPRILTEIDQSHPDFRPGEIWYQGQRFGLTRHPDGIRFTLRESEIGSLPQVVFEHRSDGGALTKVMQPEDIAALEGNLDRWRLNREKISRTGVLDPLCKD